VIHASVSYKGGSYYSDDGTGHPEVNGKTPTPPTRVDIGDVKVNAFVFTNTAYFAALVNDVSYVIKGTNAADTLVGSIGGNDSLFGGSGNDVLTGASGVDTFFFDAALGASNVDRITDFSVVDDTIQLENSVFSGLTTTGPLASAAFWVGSAAHDSSDRIVYDSANGALY
jgi:Ca2+-binding RTX toxin-like protein